MNAVLSAPFFAAATAEPTGPVITVETALLVILSVGLVLAVKALLGLQRRVAVLSAAARVARQTPPAPPLAAPPPPELVAVIAAAVHATVHEEHRIVAISTEAQSLTWAWEGRRQILGSHKVR